MRRLDFGIAFAAAALLGGLVWNADLTHAQPTATTPTVSSGNLPANQSVQLIAPNPTRRTIRICNTGASNNLWIWPLNVPSGTTQTAAQAVSDYVLAPLASNVISCYTPPTGMSAAQGGAQAVGPTNGYFGYSGSGTGASVEEW